MITMRIACPNVEWVARKVFTRFTTSWPNTTPAGQGRALHQRDTVLAVLALGAATDFLLARRQVAQRRILPQATDQRRAQRDHRTHEGTLRIRAVHHGPHLF